LPGVRNRSEEVEMAEKVQTEISAELLEEVRRLAEEQGRSETEVVEDAVKSYVVRRVSDPEPLFEHIERWQRERGVEPLSEDEAIKLANEELHTMRRERRSARKPVPSSTLMSSSAPLSRKANRAT
jgi:hypothetical protein